MYAYFFPYKKKPQTHIVNFTNKKFEQDKTRDKGPCHRARSLYHMGDGHSLVKILIEWFYHQTQIQTLPFTVFSQLMRKTKECSEWLVEPRPSRHV